MHSDAVAGVVDAVMPFVSIIRQPVVELGASWQAGMLTGVHIP
jgi:hypothetical protein